MKKAMCKKRKQGNGGQAFTEYLVMAVCCMMVLCGVMTFFLDRFGDFYLNVIKTVCLPFP